MCWFISFIGIKKVKTPRGKTPNKVSKSWANILKSGLVSRGIPVKKAEQVNAVLQKGRVSRALKSKSKVAEKDVPQFNEVNSKLIINVHIEQL